MTLEYRREVIQLEKENARLRALLDEALPSEMIPATVTHIIDADTIVVELKDGKEERVDLLYVMTEESGYPDKEKNTELGQRALDYMKKALPEGKDVYLRFEKGRARRDGDGDLQARVLYRWSEKLGNRADCTHDLIFSGLSPYVTRSGKPARGHSHLEEAEWLSRQRGRGIWKSEESRKKYLRLKKKWAHEAAGVDGWESPILDLRVSVALKDASLKEAVEFLNENVGTVEVDDYFLTDPAGVEHYNKKGNKLGGLEVKLDEFLGMLSSVMGATFSVSRNRIYLTPAKPEEKRSSGRK
jgi:endonuclease YncB( thermonuclease family)